MIDDYKIIQIFCSIDDFCKEFIPNWKKTMLEQGKKRFKKSKLTLAEIMTIQVLFHYSNYRTFKHFYLYYLSQHLDSYFPNLVSYNRMVELQKASSFPLMAYLKSECLSPCTGISFIDSTPLRVCHNKRIQGHKTFKHLATRGKCSMGWYYGFKLHVVASDEGQLVDIMITKTNFDDRKPLKNQNFTHKLYGKIVGDKGYISKKLFEDLMTKGIELVTKLKKNMKSQLLRPLEDILLLRKRAVIETIFDQLKNICQVEHSRNRSIANYFNNIFSALIAYSFKKKKPSLYNNLRQYQLNQNT